MVSRRTSSRSRTQRNKRVIPSAQRAVAVNQRAFFSAYKELEGQTIKAWHKLRNDIRRNVNRQILIQDRNRLLLLLGECNYMTRECQRASTKARRRFR